MAKMRQVAVALDDDMREQLEQAAKSHGIPVAEEIRARLARTFEEDKVDLRTRLLAHNIQQLASDVSVSSAGWHNNSLVYEAFVAALGTLIGAQKPAPENDDKVALDEMHSLDYDPQPFGKTAARLLMRKPAVVAAIADLGRSPKPVKPKPKK